jgi:hypothetical protein
MITHPRADQLALAVSNWIEQIRPGLDPRNAFLAKVAINALSTVERELSLGIAFEAAATRRLAALLKRKGGHAELNAELCTRLRAGDLTVDTPGLVATLKASALEQLAIDQPNYRHVGLTPPTRG